MTTPADLRYTSDHEWIQPGRDVASVGITAWAADHLGDIVFVELPLVGASLVQATPFGAVESVKAVSDLFAPVSGQVVEVNEALVDRPELVNSDPYGDGWIIRVRPADPVELETLLDSVAYTASLAD